MADKEKLNVSGVTYAAADAGYFEKRTLKRSAGFWGIWGIGVAAVISGDFSGWNGGILSAGWGGLTLATLLVVAMFFAMVKSIGEMASAMPHTGGAYSFARAAMGPWAGIVTGLAETIEYVMTTAVITYFSAQYLDSIVNSLFGFSLAAQGLVWIWWIVLYAIFIALNSAGASISFKFAIVVSFISIAVLLLFGVVALFSGKVDLSSLFNIAPTEGNSTFLPFGFWAIVTAMPFAMWFFLGIEELPLAAEEAHNPSKDIPRAGFWGLLSLVGAALVVLVLNPAVTGAAALGASGEPLLDGFRAIIPGNIAAILSAFALIGLLASLQGIMFAYGRNIYSLSRAGYYPKSLSLTGKRQTPYLALIVGAVIGFASLFVVQLAGSSSTGGTIVLNIAVWGAVISYMMQMTSYIVLRKKFPDAKRPYKSSFGVPGAIFALLCAAIIFVGETLNPAYTAAIIAAAVVYAIALLLFAVFGRKNLVLSPEEEYAVSGGKHGYPESEGYGGKVAEEILHQK